MADWRKKSSGLSFLLRSWRRYVLPWLNHESFGPTSALTYGWVCRQNMHTVDLRATPYLCLFIILIYNVDSEYAKVLIIYVLWLDTKNFYLMPDSALPTNKHRTSIGSNVDIICYCLFVCMCVIILPYSLLFLFSFPNIT